MVLWITAVWLALWGDLSVGNVLGGVAVAVLLLWAVRLPERRAPRRRVSLPALAVYAVLFARDLWVATLEVARQVFWPVDRLRPAVVEVPLAGRDPGLLSLVANTITLTPGTLTLEVDAGTGRLWIHLLHLEGDDVEEVVATTRQLERRAAAVLRVDLDAQPGAGTGDTVRPGDAAPGPEEDA
ncbi:Na+/H+ antiporter subunit E [Thalassiella azotivora]